MEKGSESPSLSREKRDRKPIRRGRRIILASGSPRRRAILRMLGIEHEIGAVDVDETALPGEAPEVTARRVAEMKARAALVGCQGVAIGADTIVVVDGQGLGKPVDADEARSMLERLRGRSHEVVTGVAVVDSETGSSCVSSVTTAVWMRDYGDDEMAAYVAQGEPFDKAGAYAIQSESFHPVARIEGCYLNVVGLPACELIQRLHLIAPWVKWTWSTELEEVCRRCSVSPIAGPSLKA